MDDRKFSGRLFEVIERTKTSRIKTKEISTEKTIRYELVRRPPGVRAIILQEKKILLNREYRYEIDDWDYRLPGGKVFDTLDDYLLSLQNGTLINFIELKLCEELREEAEICDISFDFLEISHCGLTVEWDLYYFLVKDFKRLYSYNNNNIQKTEYEFIEHCWMDFSSVYRLCLDGKISESRSALVLLKFFLKNKICEGKL